MSHVHWWLVGLSFVMGLVLTSVLILRPPKGSSLLEQSVGAAMAGATERPGPLPTALESPTVQIADAVELLSATVPAAEQAPVVEDSMTTDFPAPHEWPSTMGPVPPVPSREVPPAEAPPAKKAPPAKAPPAKAPPAKAPPGKRPRPAKGAPAKRPKLPYAPYGPGSARATPEGGGPSGWSVKGRSDTRLFYTPDDPVYHLTVAQVWFKDEQAAVRAAFTPWRNSSRRK